MRDSAAANCGEIQSALSDEGDSRLYRWRVRHRRELPQDESLPPREELRLQVACSTFASWEEVGRWKQKVNHALVKQDNSIIPRVPSDFGRFGRISKDFENY